MKEPLSCLRCGKCCFVDLTAYAEKEDFDRWRYQRNSASRPAWGIGMKPGRARGVRPTVYENK